MALLFASSSLSSPPLFLLVSWLLIKGKKVTLVGATARTGIGQHTPPSAKEHTYLTSKCASLGK